MKKQFNLHHTSLGSSIGMTQSKVDRDVNNYCSLAGAKGISDLLNKVDTLAVGESVSHGAWDGGDITIQRVKDF